MFPGAGGVPNRKRQWGSCFHRGFQLGNISSALQLELNGWILEFSLSFQFPSCFLVPEMFPNRKRQWGSCFHQWFRVGNISSALQLELNVWKSKFYHLFQVASCFLVPGMFPNRKRQWGSCFHHGLQGENISSALQLELNGWKSKFYHLFQVASCFLELEVSPNRKRQWGSCFHRGFQVGNISGILQLELNG